MRAHLVQYFLNSVIIFSFCSCIVNFEMKAEPIVIKRSYEINDNQRCLINKTVYRNKMNYTYTMYNYYCCEKKASYKKKVFKGLIKKEINFDKDGLRISKYMYKYSPDNNLKRIRLYDFNNKESKHIKIVNIFDGVYLAKQMFFVDTVLIKQIDFSYIDSLETIMSTKDFVYNTNYEEYLIRGRKVRATKSRNRYNEWDYNDSGQLLEYRELPYRKEHYCYDSTGKLSRKEYYNMYQDSFIRQGYDDYYYDKNDSLHLIFQINDKLRRVVEYKYLYLPLFGFLFR